MVVAYPKLAVFLKSHKSNKDTGYTHTRIGDSKSGIMGGSYFINDKDTDEFWQKYYENVFINGSPEYITEKQLIENGPVMVDLDLRYETSVQERQHSKEHILDFIHKYIELANDILEFDKNEIMIYIMQKDNVNCLDTKTKDGIHIIFGIKCHKAVQTLLRSKMIDEMADIWDDLPITNSWEEVLDEGVTKGTVNWQVYGSRKPHHDVYKLVNIYSLTKDDNEYWECSEYDLDTFNKNLKKNIKNLSARNTTWTEFKIKEKYMDTINNIKKFNNKKSNAKLVPKQVSDKLNVTNYLNLLKINKAPAINNEQLDNMLNTYFDDIVERKDICDYKLKEVHEYTMCLPESYYGPGSFYNWIRVGWALKNTDERLFITWLRFSSRKVCRDTLKRGDEFDWTNVYELYNTWTNFEIDNQYGLTNRSIMYWAKKDAPQKFKSIHEDTVHYFIDRTLEYPINEKTGKGTPIEFDLARVLYHIFKDQFVCVSVKSNLWYEFKDNRWHELDSGTTLRELMSTQMFQYYMMLTKSNVDKMHSAGAQSSLASEEARDRNQKLTTVATVLKRTNWKNNIMREAKEAFYDPKFLEKLDDNPNLICFNNYVVDFKEKTYRKGRPDDYVSKSTRVDYVKFHPVAHKEISDEIDDFMAQLFPNEDLRRYMWEHLASALIGNNDNQTFNSYKGTGRNGKSKLVDLMSKCMGEYKHTVPVTLITSSRPTLGGTSSEVAQLKGIRYAVMQEPSENDELNEGILKELTGGDPIQGRALYKDMETFTPQFNLVVCCNERIKIRAMDDGTWRRIREVPFESVFLDNPNTEDNPNNNPQFDLESFPHQFKIDRKLDQKFEGWAPIFMSRLVDIAFKTNGAVNDNCKKIEEASAQYRESQDYVAQFIATKIVKGCADDKLKKTEVNEAFDEWCSVNGVDKRSKPKNAKVHAALAKKFSKPYNKNGGWLGWRIHYADDDDEDEGNGEDHE